MEFGFLFWLFFVGIVVASLQDLKRREVDNWLNLFLMLASFSFIFFRSIFEQDATIIFQAGFALVLLFIFMNVFYYGRVFAGGDAKLLFAMTVFFIGATFVATLVNIGVFLLFLMFAGSIYGLIYSAVLYVQNFEKVNKKIKEGFSILWVRYLIVLGVILFAFSYVNWWYPHLFFGFGWGMLFLFFAIFALVLPLLYVFAKGLEKVSMMRTISGKELREGDWLVDDIKVGRKTIKADWDGLSLEDIKLLRSKKRIKIKEGLPFVPAFLIAFILYVSFREWFIELLIRLA
ncbi:MAG: prepilin peptidase [Nanoarchaeota archaeon]|nr:prepilin peptidase [Nanoarchaeota archaeon]